LAKPKNVRTKELWAAARAGLCDTKLLGWIFGHLFFVTFFWCAKESEKKKWVLQIFTKSMIL